MAQVRVWFGLVWCKLVGFSLLKNASLQPHLKGLKRGPALRLAEAALPHHALRCKAKYPENC